MGIARALAVAEVNASMGRIVAAPTGGASGVLPAVLTTIAERTGAPRERTVLALVTAAAIGGVIAARATLSGAAGGCQAEIGSASAMAAAAAVELAGGTPSQAGHAASFALQGLLGLVCDPVGGLVEVPCVVRNATGTAVALAAVELALAGVEFPIPLDEVIDAMGHVGRSLPPSLRETARGGLAVTPTGKALGDRAL
jgi:L-serine dehydratase